MWIIGRNLARFLSVLLQPLLMPVYAVALLALYTNFFKFYGNKVLIFLIPVFVSTFVIPSLFILILRGLNYILDCNLKHQSDRTLPYFIFLISDLSLCYLFYTWGVPYWFLGFMIVPAVVAIVGLIFNFFTKISAHMLGIGSLLGASLSVCVYLKGGDPLLLFSILFILAGLLGVSRLYLRSNTAAQIYLGFGLGFFFSYLSVFLGFFLTYNKIFNF